MAEDSSGSGAKAQTATPEILLHQAVAAASVSEPQLHTPGESQPATHLESSPHPSSHHGSNHHDHRSHDSNRRSALIPGVDNAYREDLGAVPPPAYDSNRYGKLQISQNGLDTGAKVNDDGRVGIKINQRSLKLSNLLAPALRNQLDIHKTHTKLPQIPSLAPAPGEPPVPPLNIVIQIVGSRGDVQPFVALGQELKNHFKHRVRIATHPVFRDFVLENGLEFFSIGGDPSELMAFMVKNPGLMPGIESLKSGDVGKRRKGIYEMITGCWRSCIETGDGTGVEASDSMLDNLSFDSAISVEGNPFTAPFVCDAIIANPPSFAGVHIAEKLGVPLHMMFTMPWSPTQSFPHPLASIDASNADTPITNFISYALVDMLTWQGLGDIINRFREKSLGLEPVSIMWAPGMTSRLRIPWTYCWSPALIPKPKDWGDYIDISGFFFLNLATNYTPTPDLGEFLEAGPPPVYIGFGSIVVDDPNAMTKMIFDAVKKTGQRALVSKGWGGFGADQIGIPEGVFMLGNVPHDWLFKKVSCVVHHGGAGTTAAGIAAGRPTVVVPFFGDQPFWGAMTARAGAGPMPIPYKDLTSDKLAEAIQEALKPQSLERAAELSARISQEKGAESGANSFHRQLRLDTMRCHLAPSRAAVWRVRRTDIRMSTFAATVLGNEGLLDFGDLKLYRAREYETEDGPWDPITGGASALIGTIGNLTMGIADFPLDVLKSLRTASTEMKQEHERKKSMTTSGVTSPISRSSTDVSRPSIGSELLSISSDTTAIGEDLSKQDSDQSLKLPAPIKSPTDPTPRTSRQSTGGSLAHALKEHGRRLSRSGSRHGSRTSSPTRSSTSSHHRNGPCPTELAGHLTIEGALSAANSAGRIVQAGMKSPLDFTMSIAQGFHNAPKLYGDDTVRPNDKITGIQSGLKAAGKEFGYGLYDGITGLVTQPLNGAKKEGAAGLLKGAAKGIGGLILKPGASFWGLPGYTFKGIYAELQKHHGSSVQNYIIAARTAQGYEDWKNSTPEERTAVIAAWKSVQHELHKQGKRYGKQKYAEIVEQESEAPLSRDLADLPRGFAQTKHLSYDERKAISDERQRRKKEEKKRNKAGKTENREKPKRRCQHCPFHHDEAFHHSLAVPLSLRTTSLDSAGQPEPTGFEDAIQRTITATSKGNPDEDAMIERALRASVKELQNAHEKGRGTGEVYERAVAASIKEANKTRRQSIPSRQSSEITKSPTSITVEEVGELDDNDPHDRELAEAVRQSLAEYNVKNTSTSDIHDKEAAIHDDWSSDSGLGTEDDEDYKMAVRASEHIHQAHARPPPPLPNRQKQHADSAPENDEELQRAITESEAHSQALEKARTEEEIVMEYVKRQSLAEEEHRRKREGGGVGAG